MSVEEPDHPEGFLSRWSRRKRGTAAGEAEAAPAPASEPAGPVAPPAEPEEEVDLSLLPDIETLTAESDITLFLKKGVPEALKNAALRKIWSADPAIRDYIGPVDYQWDFNDPMGVPGFGPLGPDVDVEALLRQVIGEPGKPLETAASEGEKLQQPAIVPEAEQSAYTKVEELASDEAEEQVDPVLSHSENVENPGSSPLPAFDEREMEPRPRRHGGALPL
ncbi:MAG: DUF3306 domain-containing protein [Methylobacterium sp.]|nr:DUF3306 domain-containing protein [Methylobacterium sp.]MCA3604153.1 DUF3306 domain-containing protein [Methylobacterium sp.]MCA3615478.1 DUF3306 domain-containing protein [Methylobacterium sp.]MCA4910678.1 DUF3306 domain-containing protein [Methylobacterium sp.]